MKSAATRIAVALLSLSGAGLTGIAIHEGFRGEAYQPTSGDKWTIGFGSTEGVKPGDRIDPVAALARKQREISRDYESAVKRCVKVPMHQHEFDAMVDTTYNIGSSAFCSSTMVKRLNEGDYRGACDALLLWRMYTDHSTGIRHDCSKPESKRICGGLWDRRQRARAMCLGEL